MTRWIVALTMLSVAVTGLVYTLDRQSGQTSSPEPADSPEPAKFSWANEAEPLGDMTHWVEPSGTSANANADPGVVAISYNEPVRESTSADSARKADAAHGSGDRYGAGALSAPTGSEAPTSSAAQPSPSNPFAGDTTVGDRYANTTAALPPRIEEPAGQSNSELTLRRPVAAHDSGDEATDGESTENESNSSDHQAANEPSTADDSATSGPGITGANSGARLESAEPKADGSLISNAASRLTSSSAGGTETLKLSGSSQGVALRWRVPASVNLNEEAVCNLTVLNTETAPVFRVAVHVNLPQGAQLAGSTPEGKQEKGILTWEVGTLKPSESRQLELRLKPNEPGNLKPVAAVTLTKAAEAEVAVNEPKLELKIDGPGEAIAGQSATFQLHVSNPGSGAIKQVSVQATLPENLHHPRGRQLLYKLGNLGPGQSRQVRVPVTGLEPGKFSIKADAIAGKLVASSNAELEIRRPELDIKVEGPGLRFVNRKATYVVTVHNPSAAAANNVQVTADVPEGFRFVEASQGGGPESGGRQVRWFVGRLEADQKVSLAMELMAEKLGDYRVALHVTDESGVDETAHAETKVDGFASLNLEVTDAEDPVEVGAETAYEVRISNSGSKAARDVQVAVLVPEQAEIVATDGAVSASVSDRRIVFDPVEAVAPGETKKFIVRVRCNTPGRAILRAYYRSAEVDQPLQTEEITRIYEE